MSVPFVLPGCIPKSRQSDASSFAKGPPLSPVLSHVISSPGARTKRVAILGVGLTHLVESKDLLFLEAEAVENISQWDVLKNSCKMKALSRFFQML